MSTWDAARLASRRQLPKTRKMMGPVGEQLLDNRRTTPMLDIHDYMSCHDCGHHVCSCSYERTVYAVDLAHGPDVTVYTVYTPAPPRLSDWLLLA